MGWNNSWQVPVSHLCEKMFAATSGLAQFVFTPFPPHCDLKMHDSGCLKLASPKAGAKEAISWKSFVLEQQSQREKRNVRKEGWSRWGMDTLTSAPRRCTQSRCWGLHRVICTAVQHVCQRFYGKLRFGKVHQKEQEGVYLLIPCHCPKYLQIA